MSENVHIQAVGGVERSGQASHASSMATYQRWLADSGNMPLGHVLAQHPQQIAASALGQAGELSHSWNRFLAKSADLFSSEKIQKLTTDLRQGGAPANAPSQAVQPVAANGPAAPSATAETSETSVQAAQKAASAQVTDTAAMMIELQWRQTAALLEHNLSGNILMSAVQSSVSSSKEIGDGIDSLLRG